MSTDFMKYMNAQAEKDAAYPQYNHAVQLLEKKQIMSRYIDGERKIHLNSGGSNDV